MQGFLMQRPSNEKPLCMLPGPNANMFFARPYRSLQVDTEYTLDPLSLSRPVQMQNLRMGRIRPTSASFQPGIKDQMNLLPSVCVYIYIYIFVCIYT